MDTYTQVLIAIIVSDARTKQRPLTISALCTFRELGVPSHSKHEILAALGIDTKILAPAVIKIPA